MIKVVEISASGQYRLQVRFNDGASGELDLAATVREAGPMVEPLREPDYFRRVFLEFGAPTWPNGFDLSPDWVRREIEAAGALVRSTAAA